MIIYNNSKTEIEKPDIFELHARFCKSLSNPKRLIILAALAKGEKSVGYLAEAIGVTLANISQHLTVLRSHNIVNRWDETPGDDRKRNGYVKPDDHDVISSHVILILVITKE
jgi:DNA-binding transcriptional ArsR family regulator